MHFGFVYFVPMQYEGLHASDFEQDSIFIGLQGIQD
jgi:hypothetical protein